MTGRFLLSCRCLFELQRKPDGTINRINFEPRASLVGRDRSTWISYFIVSLSLIMCVQRSFRRVAASGTEHSLVLAVSLIHLAPMRFMRTSYVTNAPRGTKRIVSTAIKYFNKLAMMNAFRAISGQDARSVLRYK